VLRAGAYTSLYDALPTDFALPTDLENAVDFRLTRKISASRRFAWAILVLAIWRARRCFRLAEVRIQEGEPLENALRRFKRKVQTEDIIKEVKRHSFYLKPGEKKRVKEALARKRNRKKIRKEQD
jgi:small subunit ribosomal protein S21